MNCKIMYTYDEAMQKISELFNKLKSAPNKEELSKIRNRNYKVRHLTFYISIIVLGFIGCFFIYVPMNKIWNHQNASIFYSGCFIGAMLTIFGINGLCEIYNMEWDWPVKIFDYKYYKKYKDIGLFHSREDYILDIKLIALQTDLFVLLEESTENVYVHGVDVHFDETGDECTAWIRFYSGVDNEGKRISEIKTLNFLQE